MQFKSLAPRFLSRIMAGLLAVSMCVSLTGCKGEEVYDGIYKSTIDGEDVYTSDLWGPMHEISFWGMNMLIPDDFESYEPSDEEKANNTYWQYDRTFYKNNTTISAYVIGAGGLIDYTETVLNQKSTIKEYNDPPTRIVVEEPNFFYYQFDEYDQYGMFRQAGDYIIFVWIISNVPEDSDSSSDSSGAKSENRVANMRSEVSLEMARQIEASLYVPGLQEAQSGSVVDSKSDSTVSSTNSSIVIGESK